MKHTQYASSIISKFVSFCKVGRESTFNKNNTAEKNILEELFTKPKSYLLFPAILSSPIKYLTRNKICVRWPTLILTS